MSHRAAHVWKGSWVGLAIRRSGRAIALRCSKTARTPTTTGSRPSRGRSVGSTWTTTSSRTTKSETGSPTRCLQRLRRARVRVLHDWFGCLDVPRSFWKGMREVGVQVKAVNPPASGPPLGVIRRDHRKLIAVDGEYASTGGVCISDGWLVTSPETGLPYRDTAVSIHGPAVADVERAFAGVWDEMGERLPDEERPDPKHIQAAGQKAARVVVQEPRRMRTLRMLELLTAGVQERLWITDPYFLSLP